MTTFLLDFGVTHHFDITTYPSIFSVPNEISSGSRTACSAHCHLSIYPIFRMGTDKQKQDYLIPAINVQKGNPSFRRISRPISFTP
jgi:hypothetical protein